ncbi:zinc-binding dehydrogenase [Kineosporia sp. R_H_3]|uniref:zinc-dependent alcohol dehydrogenase n=1 Tax=Kineosporia sp. R_H_3 TaxID=1961848 RepID=UPI0018E92F36|nr:zinc-binding dehydrogenase [Kineosporia sp. R_H_3]
MDDQMLAARLHGTGDLRVAQEPVPVPREGESLVRVTAVGICGSDLHWYSEGGIGDARLTRPLVVGHEAGGVVASGPRAGQRVAIDPAVPCGHCELCLAGHRNLCPTVGFLGHGATDGALRELVAWPDHLLHPVPDALSAADVAMLEPLGVAIHAHDLGHQRAGATVVVVGCGPIGLCLLQVARAAGATTVLAVDPLPHRAEAALRLGADAVLPHEPAAFAAALAERTSGRGVDVAFEAVGSDAAVGLAIEAAMPGARVVLAGIPDVDSTTFTASTARRKGLTIALVRRMKEVYPRATALVERGTVDVRSMVSHTFGLAETEKAFQVAHARTGLKVVVAPTDDV